MNRKEKQIENEIVKQMKKEKLEKKKDDFRVKNMSKITLDFLSSASNLNVDIKDLYIMSTALSDYFKGCVKEYFKSKDLTEDGYKVLDTLDKMVFDGRKGFIEAFGLKSNVADEHNE